MVAVTPGAGSTDPVGAALVTGLGIAGICVLVGFTMVAVRLGVGFAIPGIFALAGLGAAVFLGPVGKALARRLETPVEAAAPAELEDLRERVALTEQLQGRVAELEERLDFAERLLTRQQDPVKLPPQR
jgi:hypothetical protein